jgi:hypothetical protein
VDKDRRIAVDVDWDAVPAGVTEAELTVRGPDKANVVIKVPVHARADAVEGHVETGGVIAIEAEHYTRALAPVGRRWQTIPGYGRTLSGVTTMPGAAPALTVQDGMRLEYDVHLFSAGEVKLRVLLSPTLKFQPGAGFRYAVSVDDGPPEDVNVHADQSEDYWRRIVSDGVAQFVTTHRIDQPGKHTLKFWSLDPGLVLQRLVIDAEACGQVTWDRQKAPGSSDPGSSDWRLPPQSRQTVIRTLTTVVDAFTWPIDDDYLLRPEIRLVLIHDATSVTAKPRWLLNVPRLSQATPRP